MSSQRLGGAGARSRRLDVVKDSSGSEVHMSLLDDTVNVGERCERGSIAGEQARLEIVERG